MVLEAQLLVLFICFFKAQGQLVGITERMLLSGYPECEEWAMVFVPLRRHTCFFGELCKDPQEICATTEQEDVEEFQETGVIPPSVFCEPVPKVCQKFLEQGSITNGTGKEHARFDAETKCCQWAEMLQIQGCERIPFWIRSQCHEPCKTPGCRVLSVPTCKVSIDLHCQQAQELRERNYIRLLKSRCRDSPQYANQCPAWRHTCESNPEFMKIQCQHTCNTCHVIFGNTYANRHRIWN